MRDLRAFLVWDTALRISINPNAMAKRAMTPRSEAIEPPFEMKTPRNGVKMVTPRLAAVR